VAGLSENALVERIAARTRRRAGVRVGIGDDAAVLDDDPPTVLTQDLLVEDVHFRLRGEPDELRDLGHRALAVNLSDLAAMGAAPVCALVGLGLPGGRTGDLDLDALYDGMEALAEATGCTLAGGDTTRAPALTLAVTAVGRMPEGVAPCRRSGARPGDVLAVTGPLGASAAGLLISEDPVLGTGVPEAGALRAAHRRPEPRLAEGERLARAPAHALMDLSDGLGLDGLRMARASGVSATVELERVPLAAGVGRVAAAAGREADVLAATGGEDYELLAALPEELARELGLHVVGSLAAGPPGLRLTRGGREVPVASLGWEHGA
jgi:thiamine-monophosphate kinase